MIGLFLHNNTASISDTVMTTIVFKTSKCFPSSSFVYLRVQTEAKNYVYKMKSVLPGRVPNIFFV